MKNMRNAGLSIGVQLKPRLHFRPGTSFTVLIANNFVLSQIYGTKNVETKLDLPKVIGNFF